MSFNEKDLLSELERVFFDVHVRCRLLDVLRRLGVYRSFGEDEEDE